MARWSARLVLVATVLLVVPGLGGRATAAVVARVEVPHGPNNDRPPVDVTTSAGRVTIDLGVVEGDLEASVAVSTAAPSAARAAHEPVGSTFEITVRLLPDEDEIGSSIPRSALGRVCLPVPTVSVSTSELRLLQVDETVVTEITGSAADGQVCGRIGHSRILFSTPKLTLAVPRFARHGGPDRVATSVEVSAGRFDRADIVVVASGDAFADALAAAPLAARLGAPVLLNSGTSLKSGVVHEMTRLGATQVVVVGGTAAVSASVERELGTVASVRRIAGADRYATADAVAVAMAVEPGTPVWLASGSDPADALTAGAAAAAGGGVLLLTAPDSLPAPTAAALQRLRPSRVVVAGGTRAVSDGVAAAVGPMAGSVTRVAGSNRYETAVALAGDRVAGVGVVYVVSATSWPDAIAASWLAGAVGAPLLLTERLAVPAATSAALTSYAPRRIAVVGGTAAVDIDGDLRAFLA